MTLTAVLLLMSACSDSYRHTEGSAWGTMYHITYRSGKNLDDSIAHELNTIDSIFSLFNPSSELCRVNAGETCTVSPQFIEVFREAQHVHAASGGLFDPSVAPLAALWGFGAENVISCPDSAAVDSALQLVGLDKFSLNGTEITLPAPGARLDFSAIAKGYGIDCIGEMLERNGCTDYMIEIGGEVLVKGHNPAGKTWRIQIDSPQSGVLTHTGLTIITMGSEKEAIASSGNYRNFRTDSTGTRFGHTIDPVSGYPVQRSALATSVRASTCMQADAFATAAMLMEPDSAMSMWEHHHLDGLIVKAQHDTLITLTTRGFYR